MVLLREGVAGGQHLRGRGMLDRAGAALGFRSDRGGCFCFLFPGRRLVSRARPSDGVCVCGTAPLKSLLRDLGVELVCALEPLEL
ncbi:hypothetical protein SKAU_G00355580 [Synaphobranchus kaupii]|uniref:Uncharacterized protein n=1 Tax=Synaphobranchus kaupii TaxID=118154 RepID=A0A9Q1EHB2_SYNKA|nr:hypothetical protein SKAU_G00355580 [Synaphobranchus kaupii]